MSALCHWELELEVAHFFLYGACESSLVASAETWDKWQRSMEKYNDGRDKCWEHQKEECSTSTQNRIRVICCEAWQNSDILRSGLPADLWKENVRERCPLFAEVVQVYTDEQAVSLKRNGTITFPVYLVLLNFSKTFRRFLIDHGHTSLALPPVATSERRAHAKDTDAALKQNVFCLQVCRVFMNSYRQANDVLRTWSGTFSIRPCIIF